MYHYSQLDVFRTPSNIYGVTLCENRQVQKLLVPSDVCQDPKDVSFDNKYFNASNTLVNLPIQSKCGKIRTRKASNKDTFYTVFTYYEEVDGELYIDNYLKTKSFSISLMLIIPWTTLFINVEFSICRCYFWFTVILGVRMLLLRKIASHITNVKTTMLVFATFNSLPFQNLYEKITGKKLSIGPELTSQWC